MKTPNGQKLLSQKVEILARLRDARALILSDAEAFHSASATLEHIGQIQGGFIGKGLHDYQGVILALAKESGHHDDKRTERLFDVVVAARNDAVHVGAWARHLSTRLVDLFLILEESITCKMKTVEDLMVRNPVTAETWHLVAHARKAMFENSFSCLPILIGTGKEGRWSLVTDVSLMRFLRGTKPANPKILLATPLEKTFAENKIEVVEAMCYSPGTPISDLVPEMTDLPVLVTEPTELAPRLLGIITPFDLL